MDGGAATHRADLGEAMTTIDIELAPHRRGDTFEYSTTLEGGWTFEHFTGGLKFTLRSSLPPSEVTSDADAIDQASTAGGEIVASGTSVEVTIPAARTTNWPTRRLYWDLQGVVAGATPRVYTLASGTIQIRADITRST